MDLLYPSHLQMLNDGMVDHSSERMRYIGPLWDQFGCNTSETPFALPMCVCVFYSYSELYSERRYCQLGASHV